MASAGRRPGPNRTREAILDAPRQLFASGGYGGTTVRAVAAAAGVNAALVHHYFGTKDGLFFAALNLPFDPAEAIAQTLAAGPREEFAERFVALFLAVWRDPATGRALQAALRRAAGDEVTATLVRDLAEKVLLPRTSAALGVPVEQVAAAISQLIGVVLASTILRVEPLASASTERLATLIAPAIAGYLRARAFDA